MVSEDIYILPKGTCISMAVEFTIGFRRESKRADPKGFQNTDAACGLHALPILVSLASESRKVMVAGALRCIGIVSMTILWIRRTLDIPSFNPICNSLHGSDLLSKCSNLVLQGSLLGLFLGYGHEHHKSL